LGTTTGWAVVPVTLASMVERPNFATTSKSRAESRSPNVPAAVIVPSGLVSVRSVVRAMPLSTV
jgi:hypothetical protein